MKKILVTGGAGFIGSVVAKKLIERSYEVLIIDNLSTGFEYNLPKEAEFIHGDCSDERIIDKLSSKDIEAIIHIAGQSSGEISFEDPINDLNSNTSSTLRLLKLSLENKCERFIYASSMSVYGVNKQLKVKESNQCKPKSFYAVGKLASEYYLNIFKNYGINCTSLRLFNVYGPGQNMENLKQGMLSIYLAQYLKSQEIDVKGSLSRFRDLIYIDDVAEAFIRCLDSKKSYGEIINIGTSKKITVKEILKELSHFFPESKSINVLNGTPGDIFGITADIKKMREILGEWDLVSFKDGLERMIESLKFDNEA